MKNELRTCRTVTILLSLLLVSCGNDAVSVDTETDTNTVSVETEQTDIVDYVSDLPDADYNGYEFRILGEEMRDHYTAEEQNGEVINDAVYDRNRAVEERYNVKLVYDIVTWGSGHSLIDTHVRAGESPYDLVTSTHLYLGNILVNSYLTDWSNIPYVDMTQPYYVNAANETYSINGKVMLLFGNMLDSNITASWVYLFNKRLANDYDIAGLYDAVRDGSWTLDYFRNLIKDIYQDLDGNSVYDETDFYGFVTDNYGACDSYTRTLGLSAISKDENDYPQLDFYKESTVDAYNKIYELYFETPGAYTKKQALTQIDTSFVIGHSIFSNTPMSELLGGSMRDMQDDYGILPYPKFNEEQEGYYTYLDGTYSAQMVLVSMPEENYERIGIITEALNAYSQEYVLPAIYNTSIKVKAARDEDSVEMLDIILDGRRYSFDSFDERGFMLSPRHVLRDNIQKGVQDISSYYAKSQKSCEKWIAKMIEAYEDSVNQ